MAACGWGVRVDWPFEDMAALPGRCTRVERLLQLVAGGVALYKAFLGSA